MAAGDVYTIYSKTSKRKETIDMRECVVIDGVRSANARAHKDKGWFRNVRPEELLIACYKALFERNPG